MDALVLIALFFFFVIACYMVQTLASVSQSMHRWGDSLERGLSRAQEIDRLNQDSIVSSTTANTPRLYPQKVPMRKQKAILTQPCLTTTSPLSLLPFLAGQDRTLKRSNRLNHPSSRHRQSPPPKPYKPLSRINNTPPRPPHHWDSKNQQFHRTTPPLNPPIPPHRLLPNPHNLVFNPRDFQRRY